MSLFCSLKRCLRAMIAWLRAYDHVVVCEPQHAKSLLSDGRIVVLPMAGGSRVRFPDQYSTGTIIAILDIAVPKEARRRIVDTHNIVLQDMPPTIVAADITMALRVLAQHKRRERYGYLVPRRRSV